MNQASTIAYVAGVYEGSDGDATKALYAKLEALGPKGIIAVNLFRAQKNSERAKKYRRRSSSTAAYQTKQWAMNNLAAALSEHAEALDICWGWGIDESQAFHPHVLYVDLTAGQVSFHTEARGIGPDYPWQWDEVRGVTVGRILSWITALLGG